MRDAQSRGFTSLEGFSTLLAEPVYPNQGFVSRDAIELKLSGNVTFPAVPMERSFSTSILIHLEGGDEGFLRDLDLAELAHLLLAGLLLVEQLTLS